MTIELYNKLNTETFKLAFFYATKSSCIPAFTREELDILDNAGLELFGTSLGKNRTCGRCILELVKKIAKEYYNYGEQIRQKEDSQKRSEVRRDGEEAGCNDTSKEGISSSKENNPTKRHRSRKVSK